MHLSAPKNKDGGTPKGVQMPAKTTPPNHSLAESLVTIVCKNSVRLSHVLLMQFPGTLTPPAPLPVTHSPHKHSGQLSIAESAFPSAHIHGYWCTNSKNKHKIPKPTCSLPPNRTPSGACCAAEEVTSTVSETESCIAASVSSLKR